MKTLAVVFTVLLFSVACISKGRPKCLVGISAYDPVTGLALTPPYSVASGGQIQFVADWAPCN